MVEVKTHALRLRPNQEMRTELETFTAKEELKAGFIITCVGSVKQVVLRLADNTEAKFEETYEITSLVGTLSQNGVHLHLSVSDRTGKTIGGHLKEAIVCTTAEVVIGTENTFQFHRTLDPETNYKELEITCQQ